MRLQRAVKRDELQACDRSESQKISVGPNSRGSARQPRTRAELLLEVIRLGKKHNAAVSPDAIPQAPGFGHGFRVLPHYLLGRQEPQNGDLRETAEQELFFTGLLEPRRGCF